MLESIYDPEPCTEYNDCVSFEYWVHQEMLLEDKSMDYLEELMPLPPAIQSVYTTSDNDSQTSSTAGSTSPISRPCSVVSSDCCESRSVDVLFPSLENSPFITPTHLFPDDTPYTPPTFCKSEANTASPSSIFRTTRPLPLRAHLPVLLAPEEAPSSYISSRQSSEEPDDGGEGNISDDNGSDDEYLPESELHLRKRRRSVPRRHSRHGPTSCSSSPSKRSRSSWPSRNIQATSLSPSRKAGKERPSKSADFTCNVCGWEQKNRRSPDFLRHQRTHQRPSDADEERGWRCKGVLLEDAKHLHLSANAKPYMFLGKERIGGCLKTFSRRDALKRHLDNINVRCIGVPSHPIE